MAAAHDRPGNWADMTQLEIANILIVQCVMIDEEEVKYRDFDIPFVTQCEPDGILRLRGRKVKSSIAKGSSAEASAGHEMKLLMYVSHHRDGVTSMMLMIASVRGKEANQFPDSRWWK